MEIYPNR
ncbi:hypothetical protein CP8484711_0478A, partial [Chlamydia psittaci 84-8471/1]